MIITEINKDTFWALIDQAKGHWQFNTDEAAYWLAEQLVFMGPEQARTFDAIAHIYIDLACQYGLWNASWVMDRGGTSDDGFLDFRRWLVGQGKDVYLAALKDPDSLADASDYRDWQFESLSGMGGYAYEQMTGRNAFEDFGPIQYRALKAELKKDIVYGEGIGYPYDWQDLPAYLPRLCAKYFPPEQLAAQAEFWYSYWNPLDPDIQAAKRNVKKSKRVTDRGER